MWRGESLIGIRYFHNDDYNDYDDYDGYDGYDDYDDYDDGNDHGVYDYDDNTPGDKSKTKLGSLGG